MSRRRRSTQYPTVFRLAEFRVYFNWYWERLAVEGACDALGGAEYQRVWSEWEAAGHPRPAEEFIRRRANVPPTDRKDCPDGKFPPFGGP